MLEYTRTIFELKRKKGFGFFARSYNKILRPEWAKPNEDRRFDDILNDQKILINQGEIYLGHLVQANVKLFENYTYGTEILPAAIIYGTSKYYETEPDKLQQLANKIYELKNENIHFVETELKPLAYAIKDEYSALKNYIIPESLTGGIPVRYSTILVQRVHVPKMMLVSSWIPILALPEKINTAMILPSKYWAKSLVNEWCG